MTTEELEALSTAERTTLAAVADRLIPAAGDMPSAAEVVTDERLRFVLNARPDLLEPLRAALRPELGDDEVARLDVLGRDEPATLYALQLVIVAGYYTDARVRELIGYPGQMALALRSWEVPAYIDEGLVDRVLARGPVDDAVSIAAAAEQSLVVGTGEGVLLRQDDLLRWSRLAEATAPTYPG